MRWTYSIKSKILASAVLLSLCLLVLLSNFIDRNHTRKVNRSISTLYEDRLIAEVYILKMTSALYQIREGMYSDTNSIDKTGNINKLLLEIDEISSAYLKTKFTDLETIKAGELLNRIQLIESDLVESNQLNLESIDEALILLEELSAIQVSESGKIMDSVEVLYLSGKIFSQLVFVLIIVILVVLQALVFASKSLVQGEKNNFDNLN